LKVEGGRSLVKKYIGFNLHKILKNESLNAILSEVPNHLKISKANLMN
jgi:hypothetical protein